MERRHGFGVVDIILSLFFVLLVGGVGLYIMNTKSKGPTNNRTNVQSGEVRLHGKITSDDCFTNGTANSNGGNGPAIGDVGCSITVNGYSVAVILGNIAPPKNPGTVSGLENQNQVGHYADIYAKQLDSHTASIWDASKYYVKIY